MNLCLAMIVKNEERGIVPTLESVSEHVDSWSIVDTHSTDDTMSLALGVIFNAMERKVKKGRPDRHFFVGTEPFIDFSKTRNRAIAHAEDIGADWILMLSGDMLVERAELLRDVVEKAAAAGCIAARVRLRSESGLTFARADLIKANSGCRYVGAVHESMHVPGEIFDAADCGLVLSYRCDPDRDRARWPRDAELLQAELKEKPNDPRTTFYLAQTLECMGFHACAATLYERRIRLEGYWEERVVSALRRARCLWRLGAPSEDVVAAYLEAHIMCPERAEAAADLADYWAHLGRRDEARTFAQIAVATPAPKVARLFVESDAPKRAKTLLETMQSASA